MRYKVQGESSQVATVLQHQKKSTVDFVSLNEFVNQTHIAEESSLQVLVNLNVNETEPVSENALFLGRDPRPVSGWCWRMLLKSGMRFLTKYHIYSIHFS